MDDRTIADIINDVRDIAINFHAAEQLRARLVHILVPHLSRIRELEDRNAAIHSAIEELRHLHQLGNLFLEDAKRDLDALREDSARLDYLSESSQITIGGSIVSMLDGSFFIADGSLSHAPNLRAAIDAARGGN